MLSTLLGCAGGRPGKAEAASHPMARKPAPDIEVKLASGAAFHPRDAKGKVLVLDFWATWCAPCKASFPKVDAIYKKHASQGLEVVAINEDEDPGKVPPFLAEVKPSFTIAYDNNGKGAEAFGVETMPSSFVIDRRGVVRYAHSGYHPDDAATIESEIEELLAEAP
jgi:cytochrome c biogenesis protein CcmG/thiol:disulfide interchange protein DsbE